MRAHALALVAILVSACGSADDGAVDSADETVPGAAGGSSPRDAGAGGGAGVAKGSGGSAGTTKGSGGSAGAGAAPDAASGGGGGAPAGTGGACLPTDGGAQAQGQPGVWEVVTPGDVDLAATANGAEIVLTDPARPSDVYIGINNRGMWKSTDFGLTWRKSNTGTNGDKISTGGFPYGAIDLDPCRDPATSPAIYVTQLFGAGCVWKSTDGAVSWTNAWNNNIFAPDGVTNISADVGGDVHSIHVVDPSDPNHLIVSLHGYGGTGDNNGVFESKDGGAKWILHKLTTFSFQPHNDVLFPLGPTTWMVTPGTVSSRMTMFRTTDGAASWADLGDAPARAIGRSFTRAGSAVYAGTDYNSNAYKTVDEGLTWTKLANSGGQISWVVATATKVYASGGYMGVATVRHASLADDATWTADASPAGVADNNGHDAKATFDGSHYVIIAAQHKGGVWRYVEP